MLWSYMTARGVGDLQKVDGCLNVKDYISILHGDLYLSLERLGYLNLDNVIFQHDNAPIHKAKIVQKWFLEWPAQSPDLNPIEHVWAILKHRLNSYPTPLVGLLQLWECVEETYKTITTEQCERLYASMPNRIVAVLATRGKWTRF